MDDQCIYVHDPDPSVDENSQLPLDCQYVPIARDDFDKMSAFGSNRLRAAVVLSQPPFWDPKMIVVNIKRIVTRLFDQIVHDDLLLYFSATRDRDAFWFV